VVVGDSARPKLRSKSIEIEGLSTVCRELVLLNSVFPCRQLLGSTPEHAAQISEWINLFLSKLPVSGDVNLKRLNDHLMDRVYLVGRSVTLADLIVYVSVHPDAVTFPKAQYGMFCNLLRWHDFVQDTVDSTSVLKPVKRKLPAFDFSAPQKKTPLADKTSGRDGAAVDNEPSENSGTGKEGTKVTPTTDGKPEETTSKKKQQKEKKEKQPKEAKKKEDPRIDMLDLRIGKIQSVKAHPDADSLYIEEIDVGEEKPRQIISGLKKFMSEEAMQGRAVIVCCNLKPANMRGVQSYGMVMCASDAEHTKVEPLLPPEGVAVGEKISFEGFEQNPLEEIKPKQKILETLFPDLVTDAEGIAKYKDTPFMSSKGPVRSNITSGNVR